MLTAELEKSHAQNAALEAELNSLKSQKGSESADKKELKNLMPEKGCDGNPIPAVYKPFLETSKYKDIFGTVLVVGADRGLGLELVTALTQAGCKVYGTSRNNGSAALIATGAHVVTGIDMLDYESPDKLANGLPEAVDTYIHSAGYFTVEGKLENLNREEEVKMYEVCAIAPVFCGAKLLSAGKLKKGSKVGIITSEGGSIGLRSLKEGGGNYGHHGSKAASNMSARLMAWDMHSSGVAVVAIHPGFLRTDMTADKYAQYWDELGAISAKEAVPYNLQPLVDLTLDNTGKFVAALGAQGLGLGIWALPLAMSFPKDLHPGDELPF